MTREREKERDEMSTKNKQAQQTNRQLRNDPHLQVAFAFLVEREKINGRIGCGGWPLTWDRGDRASNCGVLW